MEISRILNLNFTFDVLKEIMTTVIYIRDTKEVLAVLPDNDKEGFVRGDIEIKTYGENEPTFNMVGKTLMLNENLFTVKL